MAPMTNTQEEPQSYSTTRRQALAAIGAAFTLPSFTDVVAASDTTKIPYVVNSKQVLKRKEVPQAWLEHVRHVRKVKSDLESGPSVMSGVQTTAIASSSKTYGGKPGLKIKAYGNEMLQSATPTEYQGVIVEFEQQEGWNDACSYTTTDNVKGGVPIEARWNENGESYTGWGTAGLPVQGGNGNKRLLTANHLWEHQKCTSTKGESATQYKQDFGTVAMSESAADFALLKKTNGTIDLESEISEEGSTRMVSGWHPKDAVSELVAEGRDVRKMGVTTGLTIGTPKEMERRVGNTCNDLEGHGITVDGFDVGEGDSGGPMYRVENIGGVDWAVLVGHITHFRGVSEQRSCVGDTRDIGDKAAGHAWYHKNNEYGIAFLS